LQCAHLQDLLISIEQIRFNYRI